MKARSSLEILKFACQAITAVSLVVMMSVQAFLFIQLQQAVSFATETGEQAKQAWEKAQKEWKAKAKQSSVLERLKKEASKNLEK